MTMDYLVTCVMDEREGKTEMWYDFVWNRTRAIRKVCLAYSQDILVFSQDTTVNFVFSQDTTCILLGYCVVFL